MRMSRQRAARMMPRQMATSAGLTLGLTLLVAGGVADQGWGFSAVALAVAALAVGGLHLIFPHGPLFALSVANGLAVYICLYVVLGRAAFPLALGWARPVAFLLPVASFVAACWWRRRRLNRLAAGLVPPDLEHLPRFARWLMLSGLVGVISLSTPINRLPEAAQSGALLLAMAVIAAISARAVVDVVRLLLDIATILQRVAGRLAHLAVPMASFVSIFALLAVAFGCFYRIADGASRVPLFTLANQNGRMDFSDALHFSVTTLTTVGYGDIQPLDDGIRLLAAIQMLLGQLLLLFGFAEIMRSGQEEAEAAPKAPPPRRDVAGD